MSTHRYPWLIVMQHIAIYNTLISHYVEGECFRKIWEPLFFKYGVDFIISGHAHGYERTVTIFNYTHNECGYVHAQVWNRTGEKGGTGSDLPVGILLSLTAPWTSSNPQVGSGGQDAKQDYIDGPLRPAFCANASLFPVNYETWCAWAVKTRDPAARMRRESHAGPLRPLCSSGPHS